MNEKNIDFLQGCPKANKFDLINTHKIYCLIFKINNNMKKILLLMIIPMIFGACNKEIVEREPIPSISEGERYRTLTEALIGEHKIRPKDKNNLYIHSVVDSTSYKVAYGRKGNKAWMSKFDASGNELFSYTMNNMPEDRKYGHFNVRSVIYQDENFIFLNGWLANDSIKGDSSESIEAVLNSGSFTSFISIVDFRNGKEIKYSRIGDCGITVVAEPFNKNFLMQIKPNANEMVLHPKQIGFAPLVLMMDRTGKTLWERLMTEYEIEHTYNGRTILGFYGQYTKLGGNKIMYVPRFGVGLNPIDKEEFYSDKDDYCKIIDLKKTSYVFGFNHKTAPLFEEEEKSHDICFFMKKISVQDEKIRLDYKKCRWVDEKDPITGILKRKYEDIASCYYLFSLKDYSVIEHKITPIK